jgi:hypothetical protein
LPPLPDVKIIERFALLEFRMGEAERGKTIYEGLVDKYPKKLNIWNAYIDQIGKQGDIQGVRYVYATPARLSNTELIFTISETSSTEL